MSKRRPSPELLKAAPLFAALGDGTRLELIVRLSTAPSPLSISSLTEGSPVTRQAITKHLHVLRFAGLVHSHRQGREQLWEAKPAALHHARTFLDHLAEQWDQRLQALKHFVEDGSLR